MTDASASEVAETSPRPRPTLRDVADRAGVSVATASRALAVPDRVHAQTRALVEAAAAEVGYVSRSDARRGRARRGMVAVVVADVTNPFFFDIIRGSQRQLRLAGLRQMLVDASESPAFEADTLASIRETCDGAVVAASRIPDARLAEYAAHLPIVAVNRASAVVPSVVIDSTPGLEQAIAHLAGQGHRAVAFLAGPVASWSNRLRQRVVQRTCDDAGLRLVELGPFAPTLEGGRVAGDALRRAEVTAAVAFNDMLAIGALLRLRELGIDVPGDLSIVGIDDVVMASVCSPPLTTIGTLGEQVGATAVGLLLASLDASTPVRHLSMATQLVVRGSTAPPS